MLKFICCSLVVLYSQLVFSQTPPLPQLDQFKTEKEKIDTLKGYCKAVVRARDFNAILAGTDKGIIVSGSNNSYLSFFTFYRGYAFDELKQYDSAVANMKLSEKYCWAAKDMQGVAEAMQRLHYIYYYAGKGELRDPMMQEALQIIDTTTNNKAKSILIQMLSEYYYDHGLYEKAIDYKIKFIEEEKKRETALSVSTQNDIAVVYVQIAETYNLIKQPAKGLEYLNAARPYFSDYYYGENNLYNNFIATFLALQKPDSAVAYYKKMYSIIIPGDTLFESLSAGSRNLAGYFMGKKRLKEALSYAQQALMFSEKSKEPISVYGSHQTLGNVYYESGNFQEALVHLKVAENNADAFGRENFASTQYLLAKSYAGLGDWQQAYLKYDAYTILHDSIVAESSTKNIADAEAKFQNKEKQQQIENKNLQLKVGRNRILWLITGVALLLLIAVLLLAMNRNKKKTATILQKKNDTLGRLNNELEEANQTKAKLFGIISHDLRNPISQVYQFLKLQQLNPQSLNEQQKNELSTKIQTATGSLLETMEDLLLWSKTQMSEFKVSIQTVPLLPVIDSCKNLLQLNMDAKNIELKSLLPADLTVHTDPYYLQTIIRNLLQNAVKASPENSEIEIGTTALPNGLALHIKNQGDSFSQEQYEKILNSEEAVLNLNGLGLRLVDELAKKINAVIVFRSATTGSFVEVQLSNS